MFGSHTIKPHDFITEWGFLVDVTKGDSCLNKGGRGKIHASTTRPTSVCVWKGKGRGRGREACVCVETW